MKTLPLFPDVKNPKVIHKDVVGRRKGARLLVRKRPIHLILKSRYILLTHERWVDARIRDYAQRFGIRVYRRAIRGDHIHFAIQIPYASYYKKFIRALTGVIARKIGKGIWSLLPFTRVASGGRDFENLLAYIEKNEQERKIERKYEPRKRAREGRTWHPPAELAPCVKNAR